MTLTSLPFLLGMSGLLNEQIVDVKVAETILSLCTDASKFSGHVELLNGGP